RSLIRNSAERHVEVTVDRAKSIFLRALEKLNAPSALSADLMPKGHGKRALMSYGPDTINIVRRSVRRSHPQGREARRPTRCRIRPSLRSILGPPRRLASTCHRPCSPAPPRSLIRLGCAVQRLVRG